MYLIGKRWSQQSGGISIIVDWGHLSKCDYLGKTVNLIVPNVGKLIAHQMIKWKLSPNLVQMMGHSLGSHISSHTGREINALGYGKLKCIFGKHQY